VLLLHEEIHFVEGVEGCSVFLSVIREWFEKANKCYAALVLDVVAHSFKASKVSTF
jgi:meiotically up-regulated gene 157 (Mug157) protein